MFCRILTNSDEDLVVNTGATGANGALLVKKWGTNLKMAAQPRESAMEKLDALVKDTAAKVAVDKPKAKTKTKKGPEL